MYHVLSTCTSFCHKVILSKSLLSGIVDRAGAFLTLNLSPMTLEYEKLGKSNKLNDELDVRFVVWTALTLYLKP